MSVDLGMGLCSIFANAICNGDPSVLLLLLTMIGVAVVEEAVVFVAGSRTPLIFPA